MFKIDAVALARFWARVDRSAGASSCWLWLASVTVTGGYGQLSVAGEMWRAHRLSWALARGRRPRLHVLHSCDNPRCVNPSHLREGTNLDNMRDMERRGRARHPVGVDHGLAKLTREKVLDMRGRRARGETIASIARANRVSHMTASNAIAGRTWKHVA